MQKLLDTLVRVGATELANFVGRETIDVLELMDGQGVSPTQLANLVMQEFGPDWVLNDKTRRSLLLEALNEDDAERLCRILDITSSTNPWKSLAEARFPKEGGKSQLLYNFFGCVPPERIEQQPASESCSQINPQYPLFSHQIVACREAIEILEQSDLHRVLLHMPTGSGKTRTAMNIIADYYRRHLNADDIVVWLAHSEELCEQAAGEFDKAWSALGNQKISIHRCFGSNKVDLSKVNSGFIVGGIQLMYKRCLSEQSEFLRIGRQARLIVMDEAHQAIAATYKHVLRMLSLDQSTALIGLSATPGRATIDAKEDVKLAEFFGRKKVTLSKPGYTSPVDYLVDQGYLAATTYDYLRYTPGKEFSLTPGQAKELKESMDIPLSILKAIGADAKRNLLILQRILTESKDKRNKIIVFACSVDQSHAIANILSIKGVKAASVTSHTPTLTRQKAIDDFREGTDLQVLVNYGVLTTGFDAPRTNMAIIARPTKSVVLYSQMVGRAIRGENAGGNKECKIITVVDEIPGFRSVAEAFSYWDDIWE